MKTELPDFLLEMSRQMNSQDNRCTSDVIYQVRQHQYFVTKEGYSEHHFILTDDDGEFFRSDTGSEEDAKDYLLDYCEETCSDWVAKNHENELNDGRDIRELFIEKFNLSEDIEDFHDEVNKLAVQQIDVVLQTCFTEKEALAIASRYHESAEVFTYGISLYFTKETAQLRNWIESLTEKQGE